ncbi:MAG: hypothetical protein P1U89_02925 [Verrucomicrobiales bacterium]|nr:hypothetical protein [Verrucomicrobiales bacterium]
MLKQSTSRQDGFTVLEIVVVATIVLVLVGVSIPAFEKWQEKAKKVTCISKMKAIHGAFAAAITDQGEWPQIPTNEEGELPDWDQKDYFQFWIQEMEKYGLSHNSWVCPSDEDAIRQMRTEGTENFVGSYIPSWFSGGSNTPFKWNQPWVVERAGFHGGGHHVVMPDGSVTESTNPFSGR